jgi:hypothetical protein
MAQSILSRINETIIPRILSWGIFIDKQYKKPSSLNDSPELVKEISFVRFRDHLPTDRPEARILRRKQATPYRARLLYLLLRYEYGDFVQVSLLLCKLAIILCPFAVCQ